MKIPVIAVVGATASGKTALSVELAKKFGGEIVNADSMQIYKGMDIGTAKPTEEEKCGIPHLLMDFADPREPYSVAEYVKAAHECIEDITKRGKLPIITGGTGLYINSLIDDVDFEEETGNDEIRAELNGIYEKSGADKLFEMLKEIDPECNIPKENVRRIIRAIEFYRVRGITMTEQSRLSKLKESRYSPLMLEISREREELYERIDKRVDIMLECGLLKEAEYFYRNGFTKKMQSMKGIGYRQLLDYFRGLTSYDEAVRIIKRDSRRYAKRQITWFKRDGRIHRIFAGGDILKQAFELTETFLAENTQNYKKV